MESVSRVKRGGSGGLGLVGVGCEFGEGKPTFPIILQVGHISSQILFQGRVKTLGLSVSLGVVSSG